MKIKYIIISLIFILFLLIGGLLTLSYFQTKDFEKQPLNTPYSQIQKGANNMKLSQSFVTKKLSELNGKLLKKPYIENWTKDNPTWGYCYIVSEAMYHYLDGDIKCYYINMGEHGTHWFLTVDGEISDYTGEQFDEAVDYSKGVRGSFFKGSVKTDKGFISKRGYEMAKYLGLI